MLLKTNKIFICLLISFKSISAQESEIDRLIAGELKMTFPSIYFKHNSTEYAIMPYAVDSCYKNIALNYDKTINSLVIWRDSLETDKLNQQRIKKLKAELKKYLKKGVVEIQFSGNEQKISRQTIAMTNDSAKINYLLSLNSAFDISKTKYAIEQTDRKSVV